MNYVKLFGTSNVKQILEETQCLLLPHLLKSLWKENILNKEDVKELITEIESKDNIVIADKDSIFS